MPRDDDARPRQSGSGGSGRPRQGGKPTGGKPGGSKPAGAGRSGGSGRPSTGGRPSGSGGRPSGSGGRPSGGGGRPSTGGRPDGPRRYERNDTKPPRDPSLPAADEGRRGTGSSVREVVEPPLPESITGVELDGDVKGELRTLSKVNADRVSRHLVAAALTLDEDPETSYAHAAFARSKASRVASVREAAGLAAYVTGRWAEALSELRAVRRMRGSNEHLAVMADCQRGLGRPERALELAGSPEAEGLDTASRVELRIVAAGARRDLGQLDAAVLTLQCPELKDAKAPWAARLHYAYADALEAVGRTDEARRWLQSAATADVNGETDAVERLEALEGLVFTDTAPDADDDGDAPPA
jgi:hypothetical protein